MSQSLFSENFLHQTYQRLQQIKPDTPQRWGQMDAVHMFTHMNDAFKIALGMKSAVDRSSFFSRHVVFNVAVYVLPFWPKGNATPIEMNMDKGGSKPRDFYTELEFLKKMMDVFNEREEQKLKPHPMFGPLNKKQWRDLLVKHLNHHLKQFGV